MANGNSNYSANGTKDINFEPSSEFSLLKKQIDEFISQEVEPLEKEYDHLLGENGRQNRTDEDGFYVPAFQEIREEIKMKSAEAGFMTMALPERVGGGGVNTLTFHMLHEHLHNRQPDGFHGFVLSSDALALEGLTDCYDDPFQREQFFEPTMSGEETIAFGLTEPDHGSDITWMDTTAEKEGDEWVIDGTKCFISKAPYADSFVIYARTSGNVGEAKGISTFFVAADNPGLEIGKLQKAMGNWGTNIGEPTVTQSYVYLNECRVPERNMIKDEGIGFIETALQTVSGGRLAIASHVVGRSQWMFDECVDYAQTRKAFGEPIGNKQMVQEMLSDLRVDIEQVRWLYRHAAWRLVQGEDPRWEVSAAKWKGSELWTKAANIAIQIHGGAGIMSSLPFEREYRDAIGSTIYEGTNQMQKRNIAREFLDL